MEYDKTLLIADNHMRSSMKKKNGENLWSLYNTTAPVIEFNGKLADYDTRDYPYTNLLNMKEGSFIEIKDGVDIKLEPKDSKIQSSIGTMPNDLTDSSEENENNLLMHTHQHLTVTQDGNPMVVPANIGIDPKLHSDDSLDIYGPQKSPLHTHTDTGTIHVESKIITNYTLGEFLDIWGMELDNKVVKAVINSKSVSDYDSHVLKDGDNINLIICRSNYSNASNAC